MNARPGRFGDLPGVAEKNVDVPPGPEKGSDLRGCGVTERQAARVADDEADGPGVAAQSWRICWKHVSAS